MKKIISVLLASLLMVSLMAGTSIAGAEVTVGAVIYEENFNDIPDGQLPEGYVLSSKLSSGGSAKVQGGKLVIDSTNVELGKISLPDSLNQYGNYVIEADVRFVSAKDNNRWTSIVFRQQATDENFYHMCMRKNTVSSNGVEFARRTPGVWSVIKTGGAGVAIDTTETHVKVAVSGGNVYEYINEEAIVKVYQLDDNTNYLEKGGVGLMANYSVVEYDNIKISACSIDPASAVNENMVAYQLQETSIVSQAASIAKVSSLSDLEAKLAETIKANNVILNVTAEGTVSNLDNISLEEAMSKVKGQMYPVLSVDSEEGKDAVCSYIKTEKFYDLMVISKNPALVETIRSKYKKVQGGIDYTEVSDGSAKSLDTMIYEANENSAKTVIISEKIATKDNVEYLQHRLMTVWSVMEGSDAVTIHKTIQSGVNGIVTENVKELAEAYSFYDGDQNVFVRTQLVIGHRCLPTAYAENSIMSGKAAVAAGADALEIDVKMTKDGELVIYHESDLSSLTNGSGAISGKTLEQIKSLDLSKSVNYGTFEKTKIATLREFFEEFKDDDVMFVIEYKDDNSKVSKAINELLTEYNMKNRVVFISFNATQLTSSKKNVAGNSVGLLDSVPSAGSNEDVIESIMAKIGPYNSTVNFSNLNSTKLVRKLMLRGVTAYPWTYNASSTVDAYFLGTGGVTTDTCDKLSNVITKIDIDSTSFSVRPEKTITLSPTVKSRVGTEEATPEIVVIDGGEYISVDGNDIRGVSEGTAHFMYRVTGTISGIEYTIYSDVLSVSVSNEAEMPTKEKGCNGIISCGAVLIAAIGMILVRRKNDD